MTPAKKTLLFLACTLYLLGLSWDYVPDAVAGGTAKQFCVVVVEDHAKAPTPEERAIVDSPKAKAYVESLWNGGKTKHYRVIDDTPADENGNVPKQYVPIIAAAKKAGTLPRIVLCTESGKILKVLAVPDTEAKYLSALKKVGG